MRDRSTWILILSCFGTLFLICYAPALFRDHQFAYRDASEYYYWLNRRVQAEWDAGAVAALGARGERRDAAPGQPDRGGPLSG